MGLDVDYYSIPKSIADKKSVLDCDNLSVIEYNEINDSEFEHLKYFRKNSISRDIFTEIIPHNQCDYYLYNKEELESKLSILNERREYFLIHDTEARYKEVLEALTDIIQKLDFENNYFVFAWVS